MGQVEQKKRQLELEKQSLQESLRMKQQELDAVNKVLTSLIKAACSTFIDVWLLAVWYFLQVHPGFALM